MSLEGSDPGDTTNNIGSLFAVSFLNKSFKVNEGGDMSFNLNVLHM